MATTRKSTAEIPFRTLGRSGEQHAAAGAETPAPTLVPAGELEALLDALPDVVFFIKDVNGRYTHANLTLVRRLGLKRRDEVIGRSVTELFAAVLGSTYAWQDQRVLLGETVENQLEMHIFPNRTPGWS